MAEVWTQMAVCGEKECARVRGWVGSEGQKTISKLVEAQKKIQPKPFQGLRKILFFSTSEKIIKTFLLEKWHSGYCWFAPKNQITRPKWE